MKGNKINQILHKKIFEAMHRKNSGEDLTTEEIAEVKRAGKRGRHSHFLAASALLVSFIPIVLTNPSYSILMPILPFWY